MIRVKRIYDPPDTSDGMRILVDRIWPRGLSREQAAADLWLKDLAPSNGLRRWFGHQPERWLEFKRQYHRELKEYAEALGEIKAHARDHPVTLLFAARDTSYNNAVALREYLQD